MVEGPGVLLLLGLRRRSLGISGQIAVFTDHVARLLHLANRL